jgi:cholesterol oxidase
LELARLASSYEQIAAGYEIVVVGSGYGGAIAASRLARAGRQVCLLEQGKEFQPGEYPNTLLEARGELQVDLGAVHVGSRTGLYDLRVNPQINVFKGCGLGGTSLVNANVAIRAEPRVFERLEWPAEVRTDAGPGGRLETCYQRATEMLGSNPYPVQPADIAKLKALERSANSVPAKFYRPDINVTFTDKLSGGGVQQFACRGCGDCVTGCNYAAKNTTLMNYLPDAVAHGAQIFTKCAVDHVARDGSDWLVWFQRLDSGDEPWGEEGLRSIRAHVVVLAGGALGSTEVLLRSEAKGLAISKTRGAHFSGNGDVLGFGYSLDQPINGIGWGQVAAGILPKSGPCITGIIDLRDQPELKQGMVIEEGSIPGGIGSVMPALLAGAAAVAGQNLATGPANQVEQLIQDAESLVLGPHSGAASRSQVYLVMAHDDGLGQMRLEPRDGDFRLGIDWPSLETDPLFQRINDMLKTVTEPLQGTFVENPLWRLDYLGRNLTTVHPLGGAAMAADASTGVVDHRGRVFAGTAGTEVHDGLYVCDGAVLPVPVGVNPLLTISALAERSMELLAEERGWTIDYSPTSKGPEAAPNQRPGADFVEQWYGTLDGPGGELSLHFVVNARDLEALLTDPTRQTPVFGSAAWSTNGATTSYAIKDGWLSTEDDKIRYRLPLSAPGGDFVVEAVRQVPRVADPDTPQAVTSLPVTISANAKSVAAGRLNVGPDELRQDLATIRIYNAQPAGAQPGPDQSPRLLSTLRLGRALAGPLFDVYGNVVESASGSLAPATVRKRRSLQAPAAVVSYFRTGDGILLRLLRRQGGSAGTVLLLAGPGESPRIFSVDSVGRNLVEYLCARGHDVWVLDHRGSLDAPTATADYSLDQIAQIDLPAALREITQTAGVEKVPVVGYGLGAASALMAVLGGFTTSVGGVVAVAGGAFFESSPPARIGRWLGLPGIGLSPLAGYGAGARGWLARAIYGSPFGPKNENANSRHVVPELVGAIPPTASRQLDQMLAAGKLVDAGGKDAYLGGAVKLAIPVNLIQGLDDRQNLPSSSETMLRWLGEGRGPSLSTRQTVPGYASIDLMVGEQAVVDVFPAIVSHLEAAKNA